jgi:alkylation response protein AidB-like acyl-CoA dehydrogenase
MNPYRPPLEEIQFVIEHVLQAPARWAEMPAFQEVDTALAREVLLQGGRFAQDVLAPLNGPGDLEGCHWSPEGVTTPAGFADAWNSFSAGGWSALACAPDSGGQGLPLLLNAALDEMLVAANHAWTMYAGLLHGAHDVLRAHATPELRERYLARIVSGEWLATMNLTEPQAGSDLGLLRSRAEPLSPGPVRNGDAVRVTGQKIFISGGDQDLTDNIVHLVLARLPNAPAGTKGLSLFLVPKVLPDGDRNTVYCDGIEKKMGLKGSATCQMRFEGAQGWLLGEPHAGLGAMFLMMNAARLHVALQGLGHLEAATQKAHHYALDREQMRAPAQPAHAASVGCTAPARAADPIAWHPSVRRTVLTLTAQTQASRVMAYWTACLLDEHDHHPDAQRRADAGELVALLTPVVKGFLTDIGHRGTDDALGVLGGYGYIHEYGIEQQVRDSRIAMIYEGTNEVQAIDLVMRKLLGKGRGLALLLEEFRQTASRCQAASLAVDGEVALTLGRLALALEEQAQETAQAAVTLAEARNEDAEAPFRVADDALHAMGHALLAWAWSRIALAAVTLEPSEWQQERLGLCAFGVDWVLPAGQWRWRRIASWRTPLPWVSGSAVHGGR